MKIISLYITLLFISISVYAQTQTIALDDAINNAANSLQNGLSEGSVIAILNISSPYGRISDYILRELEMIIAGNGVLTVVSRHQLDIVRNEMALQYSGEVSDESAQSIGRFLGAQYIISGTFEKIGERYRFRLWAVNVETTAIAAPFSAFVSHDRFVGNLTNDTEHTTRTRTRNIEPDNGLDNSIWFSVATSGVIGGFMPGFTETIGNQNDEHLFFTWHVNTTFFEHYGKYGKFFWLPNAFFSEVSKIQWVYHPKLYTFNDTQYNSSFLIGLGALWNIRLGESQKWITHFGFSFNMASITFDYEYETDSGTQSGMSYPMAFLLGIQGGIRYRFTDFISAELTAKYLLALNTPDITIGYDHKSAELSELNNQINFSILQGYLGIRISIPYRR
jgi:hypothetical protein